MPLDTLPYFGDSESQIVIVEYVVSTDSVASLVRINNENMDNG